MQFSKRLCDIVASTVALVVLSPVLVPIAVLLRLTGEGEVFYRQARIGRYGRPFFVLKFATMLKASPSLAGGDITTGSDPRILPVGRFLRGTKINELPQLLNVLNGDMSLIGPRPLTQRVADLFPASHWEHIRHLRPGLSGIGSIVFRDEETLLAKADDRERCYSEAIVPHKSALEYWYVAHQSFWVDLKLVGATLAIVTRLSSNPRAFFADLPAEPAALVAARRP